MKRVAVLILVACAVGQVWAQRGDGKEFERRMEHLDQLLTQGYRIRPPDPPLPPEPPKRELGTIDRWRFESCMTDAAKAPTEFGVRAGLRVCREKFGQ